MKRDFIGYICLDIDPDKPLSATERIYLDREQRQFGSPPNALGILYLVHECGGWYYQSEAFDTQPKLG